MGDVAHVVVAHGLSLCTAALRRVTAVVAGEHVLVPFARLSWEDVSHGVEHSRGGGGDRAHRRPRPIEGAGGRGRQGGAGEQEK